jgi:hypothetical protein
VIKSDGSGYVITGWIMPKPATKSHSKRRWSASSPIQITDAVPTFSTTRCRNRGGDQSWRNLKQTILEASDLKREAVEVPEWGVTVYVSMMSAGERSAFHGLVLDRWTRTASGSG